MKKYILVLLMLVSPLMAQETAQDDIKNPVVAISIQLGGVGVLATSPLFTTGVSLELMAAKKKSKAYFYMKFDTAFTPTHKSLYGVNLHGLIGAGGYVFDNRSQKTGVGSSIVLNGGLQFGGAIPFANDSSDTLIYSLSFLGAEINTRYRYHFTPNIAIQLGLDLGGSLGANFSSSSIMLVRNDFYGRAVVGLAF